MQNLVEGCVVRFSRVRSSGCGSTLQLGDMGLAGVGS